MSNHGAQSNRVFRRDATHNRKTALLPKMFKTFLVVRFFYFNCIGIFILFMRVTGWHGLFPSPTGIEDRSWEGLGVGSFPRSPFSRGQVSRGQVSRGQVSRGQGLCNLSEYFTNYRLTHP